MDEAFLGHPPTPMPVPGSLASFQPEGCGCGAAVGAAQLLQGRRTSTMFCSELQSQQKVVGPDIQLVHLNIPTTVPLAL